MSLVVKGPAPSACGSADVMRAFLRCRPVPGRVRARQQALFVREGHGARPVVRFECVVDGDAAQAGPWPR
ncbi:hypothetical protein GCM10010335_66270 [Streptomyces galbus]|nr:hypothetical protein GCM10010335_66270 [Streptomyces galbus]